MSDKDADKAMKEMMAEVAKLKEAYENDPRQHTFNLLLLGESGTGKTFLCRTARKPVHIDSFDPGGTKGLRDEIAKGEVIVDTSYESENPVNPGAFLSWKNTFDKRCRMGYFNHIGTYVLDSSSTWSDAIMNYILKKAGIAGEAPRFTKDYTPQKIEIRNWIKKMLDLPCDFILTGHLEAQKDEIDGKVRMRYLTTGKGTQTIPLMFDEIWVMEPKETSSGVQYRILTQATGTYTARSRLAKKSLLAQYEETDIKKLLKKAGLPTDDKPLFK